jgi:hypothetical protein
VFKILFTLPLVPSHQGRGYLGYPEVSLRSAYFWLPLGGSFDYYRKVSIGDSGRILSIKTL